ncbi:unnamed protein product [Trichobilharzia regenti]|nr:unnamed protein product [Trichobilharzia regenti]
MPIHHEVSNYLSTKSFAYEELITLDKNNEAYNMTLPSQNVNISKNISSRRGRRSTIPLEIRDEVRRLKKQYTERRRRACISDKMNALHNLAMKLIGEDPIKYSKMEKSDILGICYTVFEGISRILKERPELLSRLHKLTSSCLETKDSRNSPQSTDTVSLQSNSPVSSTRSDYKDDNQENQLVYPLATSIIPSQMKEINQNPSNTSYEHLIESSNFCTKMDTKLRSPIKMNTSESFSCSIQPNNEKADFLCNKSSKPHTFRLPLKYRWSQMKNQNALKVEDKNDYNSTSQQSLSCGISDRLIFEPNCPKFSDVDDLVSSQWSSVTDDQKENIRQIISEQNVWRPYLS